MRLRWIMAALLLRTFMACGDSEPETSTVGEERASSAEGASSVAREVLERWVENAEGVESYTITFDVDGQETTETYVRQLVDGIPVFVPEESRDTDPDVMAGMARLISRARHEGIGEVEGESTDVLVIDDAAAIAEMFEATAGGPFRPTRLETQVGRDDRLIRQITMVGVAKMPTGESNGVITTVRFDDWRTVDGFAYPFRTTSQTEGLGMVSGRATEEIEAMDEIERNIEHLPEPQRESTREALKARVERARRPVAGGGFDVVVVVNNLSVNRGGSGRR
jgi:hypothetical protein